MLFFSMEMGTLELTKRLLAAEARSTPASSRPARSPRPSGRGCRMASAGSAEAPLFIDDNPHCTVMEMRAKARRTKARHGDLGLIVVDYLQLMTPSTSRRSENRQVEVAEISRGLKILARELECPVIALSQLNRQLEYRADKRPMLADLRESGSSRAGRRRRDLPVPRRDLQPGVGSARHGRDHRGQTSKRPHRVDPARVLRTSPNSTTWRATRQPLWCATGDLAGHGIHDESDSRAGFVRRSKCRPRVRLERRSARRTARTVR